MLNHHYSCEHCWWL